MAISEHDHRKMHVTVSMQNAKVKLHALAAGCVNKSAHGIGSLPRGVDACDGCAGTI